MISVNPWTPRDNHYAELFVADALEYSTKPHVHRPELTVRWYGQRRELARWEPYMQPIGTHYHPITT